MPVFVRLKDLQREGRAPGAAEILDEDYARLLSANPPPREMLE